MKQKFNFKYQKNKFSNGLNKICSARDFSYKKHKKYLITKWIEILRKYYEPRGQFKVFDHNKKPGVCTPKGTWSALNQFNTHATGQDIIVQFLNQRISNEFFTKGIDDIGGVPVKLIEFSEKNSNDEYVRSEIDNYFFWLDYYGDKIFLNLNDVKEDDLLYNLIDFVNFTMAYGTFGELSIEYLFKKKYRKKYDIYRNSSTKGDSDDMSGGVDLYSVETGSGKVKKYQAKNTSITDSTIIPTSINTRDYSEKGVDYLVLVQLGIKNEPNYEPNPKTMVFLPMKENLLTTITGYTGYTKYSFKKEDIIMEEDISKIFKSKLFYEFFSYCTKHGIMFNMDVTEETKIEVLETSVNITLPSKDDDFNEEIIVDGWRKLITEFESGESREDSLRRLEEFIKK